MNHRFSFLTKLFAPCLVLALALSSKALDQTSADALAQTMLTASGRHTTLVAVPHCGSGELVLSFWNKGGAPATGGDSRLIVDGFESDPALLASAQQKASALGLLGHNLYLRSGTISTRAFSMPYADHFVDLVAFTGVHDADLANISYTEIERVISLGGKAWVGLATTEGNGLTATALNTWISGTHTLSTASVVSDATGLWAVITKTNKLPNTYEGRGALQGTNSGNWFYNDQLATWPTFPQFMIKPLGWGKQSPNTPPLQQTSFAAGRMYGVYTDYSAYSQHLCAFRAHNGQLLWDIAASVGYSNSPVPCSRGVIVNNKLYDGETGAITTLYFPNGITNPTYSYVENDILYGISTSPKAFFAYDLINQTTLYNVTSFLGANTLSGRPVFAGGKLYASSGASVYCYNIADGSLVWGPITLPVSVADLKASVSGVLATASGSANNLFFVNAADGSLRWTRNFSNNGTYPDIGQCSTTAFNGGREFYDSLSEYGMAYDLLTGTNAAGSGKTTYAGGRSCARGMLTPQGSWANSHGMAYSFVLHSQANPSAPYTEDCANAQIAMGGLILHEMNGCNCYGTFKGHKGEAPQQGLYGTVNPDQTAVSAERLEPGPAYGNVVTQVKTDAKDWATHRGNNNRSGYVPVPVDTGSCVQLWKYTNPAPFTYSQPTASDWMWRYDSVTPLVNAGGYSYLAGSDGIVKCIDSNTGNQVWSYATGGWIFAAPTVANGCVYVGSGDGYAYCFEAHTGRLVWRFRAAPAERRWNYYGHMISSWPILTGVLVHTNGLAYFLSGMRDEWGVQAYAVDAVSGTMVWQNTAAGIYLDNRPGLARYGHVPGGYMTVVGPNLWVKEPHRAYPIMLSGTVMMRMGVFNLQTGAIPGDTTSVTPYSSTTGAPCGRQIGLMGNYALGYGEDFHSEMEYVKASNMYFMQTDANGNPIKPFVEFTNYNQLNTICWDDTDVYINGKNRTHLADLKSCLDSQVALNSASNTALLYSYSFPSISGWNPTTVVSGSDNQAIPRGTALSTNCQIETNAAGDIGITNRNTGAQYFKVSSGGEPYLHGLALDRAGRITVVNRNGDVVCYGTPAPVIVTAPSDVTGIDAGQSATFSVEAAGQGLTYQWQHNGMSITGATNASYAITSATDSDLGNYSVIVTNTNGSVTSAAASLAFAVSTAVTSPSNGAVIPQIADGSTVNLTLTATAATTHGAISKVEFYNSGTNLVATATSAPYTCVWTTAPGTYSISTKAYNSLGATGVSQPVTVTIAKLAVHYPMDETSGTAVHDTSGNGNNGTLAGNPNPPIWLNQSLFNGGVFFNDSTAKKQALNLGPVAALGGTSFTVSYWVYLNSNFYGMVSLYCKDVAGGTCNAQASSMAPGNYPNLTWYTTANTKLTSTSPGWIPVIGAWSHFAIVATPSEVDWYINGALFRSITPPGGETMVTAYKTFSLGGVPTLTANGLQGMMDEVRFYDHALAPSDITALYTTYLPYKVAPTVALTSPTDGTLVTATNSFTMASAVSGSHFPMKVNYYANGTLVGSGTTWPSYNFTWSNVARGSYAVTGTIVDALGQTAGSGTANITFSYTTAPTLSLNPGTYLNGQTLTINDADSSAELHYTTNGVDPTLSDPVIASGSAISITQTTVVKVRAFKSGNQPSEVVTAIYRIGSSLAGGAYHSLAMVPGAPLWAFGSNSDGQLGDGTTTDRHWPICISAINNPVSVSAGGWGYHSLAVDGTGAVWGWGYNNVGQVGDGTTTQRNAPVKLTGISNALSVSAGGYHSLAVKWDGTAWAWGTNSNGQLGNNTITTQKSPVQVLVSASTPLTNVVAVAAGLYHSLALKSDGTVWSWGSNAYGELGNGTTTSGSVAAPVTGLSGTVRAIAAGYYFSAALKSDGTVWTWGYNNSGQLGNGNTTNSTTPVQAGGLTSVTAISISSNATHVLALKSNGTVYGWGANGSYQLGDGTTTQHNTPFQISGLSNIAAVGAGGYHSIVLGNDGSLWAWGANYYGNLGNNTTTTGSTPAVSMSPSAPYLVFTTGAQSVVESTPSVPVIAQLFCPATTSVTVPCNITGSAVKNTDYTISGSSVTIPAGQTSGSITISPINDTLYRGTRSVILTMGTASPASVVKGIITSNTTTITDDDPLPSVTFTSGSQTLCENSGTAIITAQLSAPSGLPVTLPFTYAGSAVSGTDFTITGSSVSIAAGGTTANILVNLINRAGYQGTRAVTVSMGTPTNATQGSTTTHTVTITDKDPRPISITTVASNQTVQWGQPATFSVIADGDFPAYQWYRSGTAIAGATNASYTTGSTVAADNGVTYSVVVSNATNSGTSAATLNVVTNPPPTVTMFNPTDGQSFTAGSNIVLRMQYVSPALALTEFFAGATKIGETTGDIFTWNSVPSGNYILTVKITDNEGQTATSDPVSIAVSAPAAFDDWLVSHSLTGSQAQDFACPAGDHVSNLMKYALGLDPNTPCSKPTDGTNPGLPLLGSNAGNLTLTFQQDTAKGDVTYSVEASSDMVNWSPTNVTVTVTGTNGTVQTVQASVPKACNKQFLRLKVTK